MGGGFARHHKFLGRHGMRRRSQDGRRGERFIVHGAAANPGEFAAIAVARERRFHKNHRAIVQFLRMAANRGVLMIATQRRQCGAVKPQGVKLAVSRLAIGRYERGARRGQNHAILQDRFHLEVSRPEGNGVSFRSIQVADPELRGGARQTCPS